MEQLWSSLLEFINQLVSPDWGALVALIPLALAALVLLYLAWTLVRFTRAGPRRRGRRPKPRAPAGVHMPGPSYSPFLAAGAMAVLLYGLVFGGWVLAAGAVLLAFALVYWLREGMREYDHVEHPQTALVAIGPRIPPPGIHIPGPSFRPILASVAMAVLFYGLVFGGWLILAGLLMLAISLIQWLADARREYRGVVIADVTGHLPADPRPGYPVKTIATFAVLFLGAIVLNAGILPPRSGAGSTPAGGAGSPAASVAPSPSASGPAADVTITAVNVAFTTASVTVPAGKPFTIRFQNNDASIPHNVAIRPDGAAGPAVWTGEIFPGVDSRLYQVSALQAGTYTFICDLHPTMTGTLTVQ